MPATGVALACGLLGGSAAVVVLCYAPAKAAAAEIGMSAAGSTGIVPSAEVQHLRLIGNVDSGVDLTATPSCIRLFSLPCVWQAPLSRYALVRRSQGARRHCNAARLLALFCWCQ